VAGGGSRLSGPSTSRRMVLPTLTGVMLVLQEETQRCPWHYLRAPVGVFLVGSWTL
jgi:hypothetical protein